MRNFQKCFLIAKKFEKIKQNFVLNKKKSYLKNVGIQLPQVMIAYK